MANSDDDTDAVSQEELRKRGLRKLKAGMQVEDAMVGLAKHLGVTLKPYATQANETMKAVPGYASGGRPKVGRPAVVGENGPEVFVPDRSGTIVPGAQQAMPPGQPSPVNGALPVGVTPPAPMFHDVKIRRKRETERAIVTPVPPEEFGISRDARSLHDCGYCFHDVIRRKGQLIADGYDADQINRLSTYTGLTNSEELARDTADERQGGQGDSGLNTANQEVRITEHYITMDYVGDNKTCMYKVVTSGDPTEILSKEDEDDVAKWDGPPPFAAGCPIPMPHRFIGRSVADLVMDLMRIKTALIRGGLNNLYMQTNPRIEIAESHASVNTMDDLLTSRPNGAIRTKMPGGLQWQKVPDATQGIFPALQYFDAQREWRTGVSRQGQGVDPNALQNQVATIANQMEDASQAKMKMIARCLAEGVRDMFSLLHATIRRHGSIKQTVRLRGKWVTVDPRSWKARSDMTINVGLGTGSKASLLAQVQMLMTYQEKAVAIGMVSKRNFHNSARDLVRLIKPGGDVDAYFCDPSAQPDPNDPAAAPLPPPTNPKQIEMQGKQQIEQGKVEGQKQIEQMKNQTAQMAAQHKAQIEAVQMQADTAVERAKAQSEAALKQHEAQLKAALADRDAQQKAALAAQKFEFEKVMAIGEAKIQARQDIMKMAQGQQAHQQKMAQGAQQAQQANGKAPPNQDGGMSDLIKAMKAPRTKKVNRHPKTGLIESVTES